MVDNFEWAERWVFDFLNGHKGFSSFLKMVFTNSETEENNDTEEMVEPLPALDRTWKDFWAIDIAKLVAVREKHCSRWMKCRQDKWFHNTGAEKGYRGRGMVMMKALWIMVPQMWVLSDGETSVHARRKEEHTVILI